MDLQAFANFGIGGAVIYCVFMFLKHLKERESSRDSEREAFLAQLREYGQSRDREREAFLSTLRHQQETSTQVNMRLMGLAQSMADKCQSGVPMHERIKGEDVLAAGTNCPT